MPTGFTVAYEVCQAVPTCLGASRVGTQEVQGKKVKTPVPREFGSAGFLELQTAYVWLAASLPMAHRTVSKVPVSSLPEAWSFQVTCSWPVGSFLMREGTQPFRNRVP